MPRQINCQVLRPVMGSSGLLTDAAIRYSRPLKYWLDR